MNTLTDQRFWASVAGKECYREGVQALLDTYAAHKGDATLELPMALRKLFVEKGTREEFERPYFAKRKFAVACALLTLIYPQNEEYLDRLKQSILSMCEEYSWALPAHCLETDDETTCVDLFSSETAGMLAEVVVLLGERLGSELVARIEKEVERRVFESYSHGAYWWDDGRNNWTAVCCGNIGIAMMRLSPQWFARTKARLLRSMQAFIDAFPEDGNCVEGLGYWHFGFGCWVWFADALYDYTQGEIDLFHNPKIAKIASYAQKVFMKGNATVSIGDSTRAAKADEGLLSYLHEKYPAECIVPPKELTANLLPGIGWYGRSRWFLHGAKARHEESLPKAHYLFEDCGQAVANLENYSLFVKAGHNGESHNHNDIGSFILSTEHGQILCDLGSGKYFNGYFDDAVRYTLLNNASWGHSVPIVDGQYQKAGAAYGGTLSWQDNEIKVDFASAYGGAAKSLTRTFCYDESGVILSDEWRGCKEVVERFVTLLEPKTVAGGVEIDGVRLLCANATPAIGEGSYEPHGASAPQKVYLIDFTFRDTEKAVFRIAVA